MSAASRAAVYLAICRWISSFAAFASSALAPDAMHNNVRAIAQHQVALFGFLILDVPLDPKLIGDHAKTRGPECFLKRHANGSVFRQRIKQAFGLAGVIYAKHEAEAPRGLVRS